jgi:sugar transferase (PEP-CTERM/EpsH1 system associated)
VELLPTYKSYLKAAGGIFSETPLQVAYYKSKSMKNLVDSFIRQHQIDLIYVHLFRMAPYVEHYKGIYKIIDFTDVVSGHLERSIPFRSWMDKQIYSIEWPRIRAYEKEVSRKFDECWVISEREAKLLSDFSPSANIKIVPNGVDLSLFKPSEDDKGDHLVFVGHLKSAYNVDAILHFCEQILPRVKKVIPSVKLYIVGPQPHRKIRAMVEKESVVITGYVEDLCGLLNKSKIFVAPFRFCSGIQNKILEAMATGLPVVCTSVANEGLGAGPGDGILIADDPKTFSEYLIELLKDDQRRKELGTHARQFVRCNFDWNKVVQRVDEIENFIFTNYPSPKNKLN